MSAQPSELHARLIDLFGDPSTADPTKLYGNVLVSPSGNAILGSTTDDASGYKLQVTGGVELKSSNLMFSDGTTQSTAPLSNRNYIVDGNFDSWVASSVALSAGATTISATPMYYLGLSSGGAATVTQALFNIGAEPTGMTSPVTYAAMFNVTTAATGAAMSSGGWGASQSITVPFIVQHVESVRTLQGRSSTFSFWAKTTGTAFTISQILAGQAFGTGGSPSAGTMIIQAVTFNVTSSWQRFSVRIDWPTIAGKTLGTSNTDYLQIGLLLPTGRTFDIETTQWQLELSSSTAPSTGLPTPFEYRGLQAEIARVQRYYALMNVIVGTNMIDATNQHTYEYPMNMRVSPTLTMVNTNGGSFISYGVDGMRANANAAAFGGGQVIADARL